MALHFAYYNFVRFHGSLKMTPAMMAGIEKSFWTVGDLVELHHEAWRLHCRIASCDS